MGEKARLVQRPEKLSLIYTLFCGHCFCSGPCGCLQELPLHNILGFLFWHSFSPEIPFFSKSDCDCGTYPFLQERVQAEPGALALHLPRAIPTPHPLFPCRADCQPHKKFPTVALEAAFHGISAYSCDGFLLRLSRANSYHLSKVKSVQIYHHYEYLPWSFQIHIQSQLWSLPLVLTVLHWGSFGLPPPDYDLFASRISIHPSIQFNFLSSYPQNLAQGLGPNMGSINMIHRSKKSSTWKRCSGKPRFQRKTQLIKHPSLWTLRLWWSLPTETMTHF